MHKGDLIQERYRLVEVLGEGGMAVVWRAVDQRLEGDVAVKLIAPHFAEEPEFLVRFFAEAQSIARIAHPNVVSVLDFGESEGRHFIVMEHVSGGSVAELGAEPMVPERAAEIVSQAAGGAGAAHDLGIVHRDIKPANVLLTDDGRAKLADFGIASSRGAARLTATGAAIGSPHYISPEQAMGHPATPASDVYALGAVLYELITGRRLFEGDNVMAIAMAHVDRDPQSPRALVPELDRGLEAVVLRCLAKDPKSRFADGNLLAHALEATVAGVAAGGSARPVPASAEDRAGRSRRPLLVGGLVALVLVTLLSAWALSSGRKEPVAKATTELSKVDYRTPRPKDTATPSPTATAPALGPVAPSPSPTSTPDPTPTQMTPEGGSGSGGGEGADRPEPAPVADPHPAPTETAEPSPTPTEEPSPTPSPEVVPEGEGEDPAS